jgi:hypothetical protein
MQLSINLPNGLIAVQNYIEARGETRLPNNVQSEADAAYISEKGLRSVVERMKGWPVGTCSRCSKPIHNAPYLSKRENVEFCSQSCRGANPLNMKSGRPRLTGKQRMRSESKRLEYQRDLMKNRRGSLLAKNPPQATDNTPLSDAISAS